LAEVNGILVASLLAFAKIAPGRRGVVLAEAALTFFINSVG